MNNLIGLIKKYWLILSILLVAFSVRWYGIYFDYPYTNFIWDESYNISYLFDLILQKTFLVYPPSSTYPTLLPLLLAPLVALRLIYLALSNGIHTVSGLEQYLIVNGFGQVYIVARWLSVAFGTATVYLIYAIINKVSRKRSTALYTALVYSFSLVPLYLSHWGKHHVTMVFFVILCLYLSLWFEETKKHKYFYLAVLAAAAAFSVHYIGITAIIFPLWAWWLNRKNFPAKLLLKNALIYLAIIAVFYLSNFFGIKKMVVDIVSLYYAPNNWQGIVPTGPGERFYYVFRDSFYIEPVFIALFFLFFWRYKKIIKQNILWSYLFIGLGFNYLLMITVVVGAHLSRWLLTFISLAVAIAAANLFGWLRERNWRKAIKILIAVLILVPNIYISVHWLSLLKNNTALEALQWLNNHTNKDEYVYSFMVEFAAPLTVESMKWNYDHNSRFKLERKVQYVLANPDQFKNKPGLNLMYDDYNNRYQDLAGSQTKYVIISGGNFTELNHLKDQISQYHQLELAQSFYPSSDKFILDKGIDNDYLNSPEKWSTLFHLSKSGSFIDIYKIID